MDSVDFEFFLFFHRFIHFNVFGESGIVLRVRFIKSHIPVSVKYTHPDVYFGFLYLN